MAIESSFTVFVTQFGMVALPPPVAEELKKVPTRKDRYFDLRFKAGRQARQWHQRLNDVAAKVWLAGGELSSSDVPPLKV